MLVDLRDRSVQQTGVRFIIDYSDDNKMIYYTNFQLSSSEYGDFDDEEEEVTQKAIPEINKIDAIYDMDCSICDVVTRLIEIIVCKHNFRGALFFYLPSKNFKKISYVTYNFYIKHNEHIDYFGDLNVKQPQYYEELSKFLNMLRKVAEQGVRVVVNDLRDLSEYALTENTSANDELEEYVYNGKRLRIINNKAALPSGTIVQTKMSVPNDEYLVVRHYENRRIQDAYYENHYEQVPVYGIKKNILNDSTPCLNTWAIKDNTFMYKCYEKLKDTIVKNSSSGATMIMTETIAYIEPYSEWKTSQSYINEIFVYDEIPF